MCVEAVVRSVVVVEVGVVQPAGQAAVELARVREAGDFEKGKIHTHTHTNTHTHRTHARTHPPHTNLPHQAAHQTLPLNSCLRLPRAGAPRQGLLLLLETRIT